MSALFENTSLHPDKITPNNFYVPKKGQTQEGLSFFMMLVSMNHKKH
ncbi:hypothetical protein CZ794_03465 [Psychrobacter sp. JB385]|nr:hypothetical protein CZ794_03465 [Psychrobacter sp. JB385]